jgi:asparagine synthase (glutamine-hydrolysing)
MCGIFGLFSNSNFDLSIASRMSHALKHRGPDDEGFVVFNGDGIVPLIGSDTPVEIAEKLSLDQGICDFLDLDKYQNFMGHRRLSIQDLSEKGHQPMQYQDRYWIVFNGEIYNFIEIRNELEMEGYYFHSTSDTEVLLAAYDKWGVSCLNKLNGMWAFVLYDRKLGEVFLSRDRFGVKPLYFFHSGEVFIFSSEPKAILETGLVKRTPNLDYLNEFLQSGPNESIEQTAYEEIFRINNAHYIHCNIDNLVSGNFSQIKYWDLKPNLSNESFDKNKASEYAKKYYEILEDAVRLRLRADVKVGSALSGGLDSSSIVYLVNKIQKEAGLLDRQETFSCVYSRLEESHCDETFYIDKVATFLKVKSHKIEPTSEALPLEHDLVVRAMDTPFANSSMSGWHTYKLIKNNKIIVTLEGQGADELLAGYLGYIYIHLSTLTFRDLIKEAIAFLKVPGTKKHIVAGILFNILNKVGLYSASDFIYRKITQAKNPLDRSLNERLVNDSMNGLVNLLHYGDRVSMAHSVESRMPFLDYRLAEFLISVPACYKMHDGWTKYLARLAFNGLLPDDICWRKDKMGWPVPEELWLSGPLKGWYDETIGDSTIVNYYINNGRVLPNSSDLPHSFYFANLAAWEKKFSVKI